MEINIKLSINDKKISKLDIKKMLLDVLFNIDVETTIKHTYTDHEKNNKLILKIKRDNE